jgi:putative nucleotidyltransferase with HDIG domain
MLRTARALIVENDDATIERLKAACERAGCQPTVTGSVASAKGERLDIDLLLVAETLGDGTGVDLLIELKRRAPNVESLVISAQPSLEAAVDALRAGAIDYVARPLPPDALLDAKLRLALERREVSRRLERTIDDLRRSNDQIQETRVRVELAHLEALRALVETLEARDPYTRGHSERVGRYSQVLALELRIPSEEARRIRLGALLHDIGKIGIRDEVLLKPTRLTPEEYTVIKQHPVIGAAIMSQMTSCDDLVPMVKFHHERIDGRGYPDGLLDEQIPRGARVIAVADAYDAMTTTRPYRRALSADAAITEILSVAGKQVDREMAEAFCRAAGAGRLGRREGVVTDPFMVAVR